MIIIERGEEDEEHGMVPSNDIIITPVVSQLSSFSDSKRAYKRPPKKDTTKSKGKGIERGTLAIIVCCVVVVVIVAILLFSARVRGKNKAAQPHTISLAQKKQQTRTEKDVELAQTKEQLAQAKATITKLEDFAKQMRKNPAETRQQPKPQPQPQHGGASAPPPQAKDNLVLPKDQKQGDVGGVVELPFDKSRGAAELPLDFLSKNPEGKGIDQVLYKEEETRKKRREFNDQRHSFINAKTKYQSIFLAKYNLVVKEQIQEEGIKQNTKEWQRLENKFNLSEFKQQLPMCVMVPGYNNNAKFRLEYNLNSIFSQNYTNYKVVLVNDASSDGTDQLYREYFRFYNIDPKMYVYVQNKIRVTALRNIYQNSIKHCGKDSIVVTLDADDEFIGRNVLQVFSWGYQKKKSGVLYSNFYWYNQPSSLMYGFTSEYPAKDKEANNYRKVAMKFSHLRSYRNELIHQIKPKDLQDNNGVFFTIAYDMALFFPLMELACGRVNKIEGEYHYLYNTGTGLNDYTQRGRQVATDQQVRKKQKYACYEEFDERMKAIKS